jgi:hypothetical protein
VGHILIWIKRPHNAASTFVKLPGVALDQTAFRVSVHDEVMTSRSKIFRLKALECDQRAREATDPASKASWQELAIEWHAIANVTATAADDASQLQFS